MKKPSAGVAEWHTRRSQKPLSKDVRVRISPPAPKLHIVSTSTWCAMDNAKDTEAEKSGLKANAKSVRIK